MSPVAALEFRMEPFAMPIGGRQYFKAAAKRLALAKVILKHVLR